MSVILGTLFVSQAQDPFMEFVRNTIIFQDSTEHKRLQLSLLDVAPPVSFRSKAHHWSTTTQ